MNSVGHEVVVVSLFSGGPFWDKLEATPGVRLERLSGEKPGNTIAKGLRIITGIRVLRKLLRIYEPCVLYSMLYVGNFLAWIAAGRKSGVRLVWGIRSSLTVFTWQEMLFCRLCRWVSPRVPLIVFNSHAALRAHEESGFHCGRAAVVRNGIDTREFCRNEAGRAAARRQWRVTDENIVIGVVGRLHPVKGHETLIQAAEIVSRERDNLVFVVAGKGARIEYLKQLVHGARLQNNFRWLGYCGDMTTVYSGLDLLVSASYGESLPNVVGEAMACEVPCIVTDVGDSAEIAGPNAIVVPPRDALALADGIRRACGYDLQRWGVSARKRVDSEYSLDRLVEQTFDALRHLDA
jgi:glycosyltransferase involved in cell wall biosynthesis